MDVIRAIRFAAPVLLAGLFFFGCTRTEEEAAEPEMTAPVPADLRIVATVNGDPITLGEFLERLASAGFKPDQPVEQEIKVEYLNRLIEQKMLVKEAQRRRIKVGLPEINQRIEQLQKEQGKDVKETLASAGIDFEKWKADIWESMMIEKLLDREVDRSVSVSQAEIRRYYTDREAQFERPEQIRARQIVTSTQEEAQAILEELQRGVDFALLARRKSTAPEAAAGGDLGYFAMGEMPAEFNAVFTLPKGGTSGIVKSPYGYHIFKLEDRRPAGKRSLEEVSDEIRQLLVREKQERRFRQWMNELRSRTKFEVNYEALHD